MQIAYLINEYPKVSHSFIRREIQALEQEGISVLRIALRGWDTPLVDSGDRQERSKTYYVLQNSLIPVLISLVRSAITRPFRFLRALHLAICMARYSEKHLAYHLIYLAEAAHIQPWLKKFGVTHLHAHFGTNSTEVAMLSKLLGGPPYSFTVHGPEEFDKPIAIGLDKKVNYADFVIAISSYGRSQIYRWISHAQWNKVHIVHCGIDETFFNCAPMSFPNIPRVVCVGRLCEQKGQLLLTEAAHLLAKKGIAFEIVLAGDGEMRDEIEKLISHYGLDNHIKITGWIDSTEVRNQILASRALVLPSFAEGLPVVIMEALALRRPVLSTYVAGIPELIQPGVNGFLIPPGSVDDLVRGLEEILSMPLEQLQQMGDRGSEKVSQRHSIGIEAKKLASLFIKNEQ